MSVPADFASWLKAQGLTAAVPAADRAVWGARGMRIEIPTPLAYRVDAEAEGGRVAALLAGPNVIDRHVVAGAHDDLLFETIRLQGDRLGYEGEGAIGLVIGCKPGSGTTELTILRSLGPVALTPVTPPPAVARAHHVAPAPAGDQSGSSWANAAPISAINALIEQARVAGGEVWLRADAGPYPAATWTITQGGTAAQRVMIRGVNEAGRPLAARIVGTRARPWTLGAANGSATGHFYLSAGADHLGFADLRFEDCGLGCIRVAGPIADLLVEDVTADNVRAFLLNSRGSGVADASIDGLTVRRCEAYGYSKRMILIRYASRSILIEDCYGDSQQQSGDNFSGGVVFDDSAHDAIVRRCTMRNHHDVRSEGYWNADSFSDERGNRRIRYEDCVATGNTDRGFDLKSSQTVVFRCLASDNKRNFFLWGQSDLIDCTGIDPFKRGGSGSAGQVGAGPRSRVRVQGGDWQQTSSTARVFTVYNTGFLAVDDAAQAAVVKPADALLIAYEEGSDDGIYTRWDHADAGLPAITSPVAYQIDENKPGAWKFACSEDCTVEIVGGAHGDAFAIEGRSLLMAARDFEQGPNVLSVEIQAVDANGNRSGIRSLTIDIVDVQDDPIAPAEIYSGGVQGAMYVPALGGMWADAEMTVPAGDGDRVMAMTDLSGGGRHAVQPDEALCGILRVSNARAFIETRGFEHYRIGAPGGAVWPQMTVIAAVRRLSDEGFAGRIDYLYFSGRRAAAASTSVNGVLWLGMRDTQSAFARVNPNQATGAGAFSNAAHVLSIRTTDGALRVDGAASATLPGVATLAHPVVDQSYLFLRPDQPENPLRGQFSGLCLTSQGEPDARRFRIERQLGAYAGLSL